MYVMHLHWDGGCIETVTVDRSFWARTPLNAAMNITRTVVMALIGVFLVPFYIDNLGLATYGIIPLATTMTSYVMIIADSLESACSRYSTLAINRSSDASKELSTGFFGILRTCIVLIPPMEDIWRDHYYITGMHIDGVLLVIQADISTHKRKNFKSVMGVKGEIVRESLRFALAGYRGRYTVVGNIFFHVFSVTFISNLMFFNLFLCKDKN